MISMIVAMDGINGIGFENKLLCHLPADLAYFKQVTLGKPIVMGRKTFESIGSVLPGRKNIVISRNNDIDVPGACIVNSLDDALSYSTVEVDIMVIGGAEIYRQALPKTDKLYVTRIHHKFQADTFFPSIDKQEWSLSESKFRASDEKNSYDLTFEIYVRESYT